MNVDLGKFGISAGTVDINWRLLISCLKCEVNNYQPFVLDITKYEFIADTEEGKRAYESFKQAIPQESEFSKTQYSIWVDPDRSLGGYEGLEVFQKELEQLSFLIEQDGFGFDPDGKDGVSGSWLSRGYFDHAEAIEITHENSELLIQLLDDLEFSSEFWVEVKKSMHKTLTKNLCRHDWVNQNDRRNCSRCDEQSTIDDLPQISFVSDSPAAGLELELAKLTKEFPSFAALNPFAEDWETKTRAAFALEEVIEPFPSNLTNDQEQLAQLAANGSAEAMKLLGVIHARAKENVLASQWYEKAIALGNLDALSNLGVLRFVEDEYATGIDLLVSAANRGSKMAMGNLGKIFASLEYVQVSLIWHTRAALFGNGESAMSAAGIYLSQNRQEKAVEMLRIAETLEVPEASAKLAELEAN